MAAILLQPSAWSQSYYYVFDGNSLTRVQSDPDRVHPEQWGAFYFRKGAPTSPASSNSGLDLKKTASQVMQSVQANQKFERSYEKWCGCDWGPETFFNVIAPVAMVKSAAAFNPRQVELLSRVQAKWDEIQELIERFNNAAKLADAPDPPKIASGPFAEFMQTMHKVIDQFMSINKQITLYSDAAASALNANLNAFAQATDRVSQEAPQAMAALRSKAQTSGATLTSLEFNEPDTYNSALSHHYRWSIAGSKISKITILRMAY